MEEVNNKELVTKGLLLAFGTRCKEWFKTNPVSIKSSDGGQWIQIPTSIIYNDSNAGFDKLYIDIEGISDSPTNSDKLFITSHFAFETSTENKIINFGIGLNLGTDIIDAVILAKGDLNYLVIWIHLKSDRIIKDCIVDVAAYFSNNLLFRIVKEDECSITKTESIGSDYEQIVVDPNTRPKPKQHIGIITNLLNEATSFDIVIDKKSGVISEKESYEPGKQFEKIYESTQTNKLSHGLKFLYDWENPISQTDPAVDITNGQLIENETVKIPIPEIFASGKDGWATKIRFKNGIAVQLENTDPIPRASTTTLGGMYLHDDSTTSIGDKVWIQLDSNNVAFVDKNAIDADRHRGDLNTSEFIDPSSFANSIWQHIGDTTTKFVNGYFYRSVLSPYTKGYFTSSQTIYNFQSPARVEYEVYKRGKILNLNQPMKIKVTLVWSSSTPEAKPTDVTQLIFRIIQTTSPGFYIEFSYADLKTYGFQLISSTVAASSTDYEQEFKIEQNTPAYAWKQWNTQPVAEWGTDQIELITTSDIDEIITL